MSSNLSTRKPSIFTPQLKRNHQQHQALRTTTLTPKSSLLPSKQRKVSSFQILQGQQSYMKKQEQAQTKAESFQTKSTVSIQQQEQASKDIILINEMFLQLIGEDLKLASKKKQRKAYSHSYQQRASLGEIWIDQPREIPQQVFDKIQLAKTAGENTINCLQGFIPEIAVFYYSVQNQVMFYDARALGRDAQFIGSVGLKEQLLSALYAIQVFRIAMPYFECKKSVMVFLHPYLAEMYEFELKDNLQENKRRLKIKHLFSFALPQQAPSQLYQSPKGDIYCTDDGGKIYKIDSKQHYYSYKKEVSTKKVRESPLVLLKNSTKYLASSLKEFALHVKNYTFSFWKSKPIKTWLLFDEERDLMVLLLKQQRPESKGSRVFHKFMVYSFRNELLHTFEQEWSNKNDEILIFSKLDSDGDEDSPYNFIVLMHSGRRVLLDIRRDRLRKASTIKQPPLHTEDGYNSSKSNNVISCCLQQDLMGQVVFTNHHYLILTKDLDCESQSVSYVKLQPSQSSDNISVYLAKNQPLGQKKMRILHEKQAMFRPQNLLESSRQVFYPPYELLYTNDQIVQRIFILRPIDIFLSIFSALSENTPHILKALRSVIPEVDQCNLVCFCCQIVVDSEGVYLISRQLQSKVSNRWSASVRSKVDWQMIEHRRFKDISSKERSRLIQFMVDVAVKAGCTDRQSREGFIVRGIIMYYSRLFRPIYLDSINYLTAEASKVVLSYLSEFNRFLQHLQTILQCEGRSNLHKLLRWIEHTRQLMLLIINVVNLPTMTLSQGIAQSTSKFHASLFKFLVKQCKEQTFEQIRKLLPIFVNNDFTRMYKLYQQVSPIKDALKIMEICKRYGKLPHYFVDYLVKVKSLPQAVLLQQVKPLQLSSIKPKSVSYKSKVEDFYSLRANLYQKQQMLLNASFLLRSQNMASIKKQQEQQKIKVLMGQIKLQGLIIEVYHSRIINKSFWDNIIVKFLPNAALKQEERQIIQRLNTCLIERQLLQGIIQDLQYPFLKVMHAYYFHPHSFEHIFFKMAAEIQHTHQHSIKQLGQAFKDQLTFMICKAKLAFTFQEITIILDTFIHLLFKCEELQGLLSKEEMLADKALFWPLSCCAEIGIDMDRLYDWGITKLSQFDKDSKDYMYMAACCSYLVKDFIPKRQKELINILQCQDKSNVNLKHIYSLLS